MTNGAETFYLGASCTADLGSKLAFSAPKGLFRKRAKFATKKTGSGERGALGVDGCVWPGLFFFESNVWSDLDFGLRPAAKKKSQLEGAAAPKLLKVNQSATTVVSWPWLIKPVGTGPV